MRQYMKLVENLLAEELPTPDRLIDMKAIVQIVGDSLSDTDLNFEHLVQQYARENDIEFDDDGTGLGDEPNVDANSEEFKSWFINWIEEQVWDAWGNFAHLFDGDGNATLYRVITAPRDWTPGDRHPGIYWSWDEDAAEAHWGDFSDGQVKWRLTGVINMRDVDWTTTLSMNVQPDYKDEKEIRIKDGAPVKLMKVEQID